MSSSHSPLATSHFLTNFADPLIDCVALRTRRYADRAFRGTKFQGDKL
jgi:hypothetical protein